MANYLGRGAYLGVAEEVTWGTAVARARWTRVSSVGLKRTVTKQVVPHLHGPSAGNAGQQHFTLTTDRVAGSVSFPVSVDDYVFSTFLKHAFGAVSTSGTGPYTHAITPAESLPVGLTLEEGRGTQHAQVIEGCQITRLTIAGQVGGGPITCTADFIGETTGGATTVGSPTFTTPVWLEPRHTGQLTWNSVAYDFKSFEVIIDNHLEEVEKIQSANAAGIERGQPTEFLVRITRVRTSNALQDAYEARTQAGGSFAITNGTKSITFTLYNAIIDEYSGPDAVSNFGQLEESITFRCFADSTDEAIEVSLVNANSAVY